MCVKEFLGFACGHCSIPSIRQCPLALQNPEFPFCSLPAERPIQTNKFCHGCARACWNMRVLEEEAEHKTRHEQGWCQCEVVFTEEDKRRQEIWATEQRMTCQRPQVQGHSQQDQSLHVARSQRKVSSNVGDMINEERPNEGKVSSHVGDIINEGGPSQEKVLSHVEDMINEGRPNEEKVSSHVEDMINEGRPNEGKVSSHVGDMINEGGPSKEKVSSNVGDMIGEGGHRRVQAQYASANTFFHLNEQSMVWHPRDEQYIGNSFKKMIVGADAVLRAGGSLGVPNYPSLPGLRSSVPNPVSNVLSMMEDQAGAITRSYPSKPMVVSSGGYRAERSASAPPN